MAAAYEILSDPKRRAEFDRYGAEQVAPHGAPNFQRFQGRSSFDLFAETFGDSAWRNWLPGDHVQTQFTRAGKVPVSIS